MRDLREDPILSGLTDAAIAMIGKGHNEDAVFDGMLTLTVAWAIAKEGPQEVGNRLYRLALKCSAEAGQARKGTVN